MANENKQPWGLYLIIIAAILLFTVIGPLKVYVYRKYFG